MRTEMSRKIRTLDHTQSSPHALLMKSRIAILMAGLFLTNVCLADPGKQIRIGIITDLSGVASYIGTQTVHGAQLAADEVREADIPLSLLFEDHRLRTDVAVTAAQRLLTVDKVDAIYSQLSPTSVAISPVLNQQRRLLYYSAGAVSILKANPNSYKTFVDFEAGCHAMAEYWQSSGVERVALVGPIHEAVELCKLGAIKVFPKLIVQNIGLGEDGKTELLKLKSMKVQAVLNPSYQGDIENLLRSANNINYHPQLGISADSFSKNWETSYPTLFKKISTFGLPIPPPEFLRKLKAKYPESSLIGVEHAMLSYIAIRQLVDTIVLCGQGDIECHTRELAKVPEEPEFGFMGFVNRKASFVVNLRHYNKEPAVE